MSSKKIVYPLYNTLNKNVVDKKLSKEGLKVFDEIPPERHEHIFMLVYQHQLSKGMIKEKELPIGVTYDNVTLTLDLKKLDNEILFILKKFLKLKT